MARIAGVDIPGNKRARISLRYIYGVGPNLSDKILAEAGVNPETRVNDLMDIELDRIREVVERGYKVEGDLRKAVSIDVKRLTEIGSYRGLRHRRRLPVHGQRTRTNARTKRGAKQTVAGRGRRRGVSKK